MVRLFLGNLKAARIEGTKNKIGFHFVDLTEIVKYLNRKHIEKKGTLRKNSRFEADTKSWRDIELNGKTETFKIQHQRISINTDSSST